MPVLRREVEGGVRVQVSLVDVYLPVPEQFPRQLRPPVLRRKVEGSVLVVVSCVDLGAPQQQLVHDASAAVLSRDVEDRVAVDVSLVHVGVAGLDQLKGRLKLALQDLEWITNARREVIIKKKTSEQQLQI